ncbi:MAG: small multi-drug export protein [Oscillospiraceae bacterium]
MKLLFLFFLSMVPIIELRGAVPIGIGWGYPFWLVYGVSVLGNLIPVPILIPFARRVLLWCAGWPKLGPYFQRIIDMGERKAKKVRESKLFWWALYVFVAIPAPGTGAWTGCLIATLLQMRVKQAFWPIAAGVATAGIIMGVTSYGLFGLMGLS